MKRDDIIDLHSQRRINAVRIMPAPTTQKHWTLFFEESEGRSHFVINEEGDVSVYQTIDAAVAELEDMGFNWAEIRF